MKKSLAATLLYSIAAFAFATSGQQLNTVYRKSRKLQLNEIKPVPKFKRTWTGAIKHGKKVHRAA